MTMTLTTKDHETWADGSPRAPYTVTEDRDGTRYTPTCRICSWRSALWVADEAEAVRIAVEHESEHTA